MDQDKGVRFFVWLLPILSWVAAAYFLLSFLAAAGFPPKSSVLIQDFPVVFVSLFFTFLPFFKRIRIGKLLELERDVKRTQEDVREFKNEVRSSLSVLSTNVNTMGNVSNQISVTLPNAQELKQETEAIKERSPGQNDLAAEASIEEQVFAMEDKSLALAWMRIEIERLLRKVLGKEGKPSNQSIEGIRFAGATQLFRLFLRKNPGYEYLSNAFTYVIQICNAAIHAQPLSEGQKMEALELGSQVIAVLGIAAGETEGLDNEPAEPVQNY
jgi:hypothetical protein